MAIPMICGFEPVPQAAVQAFVVPVIQTTMPQSEQQYAMYPNGAMWGTAYCMQPGYYEGGMDSAHDQGVWFPSSGAKSMHEGSMNYNGYRGTTRDSPTRKRGQTKALRPAMPANSDRACPPAEEPDAKDVTIVLSNLPKALCTESGFGVALEAAKVQDEVRLFSVEQCGDNGEAVVILRSEAAALNAMKHFRGLKCGKADGITARYSKEAGNKLLRSKEPKETQDEKQQQKRDETTSKKDAGLSHSPKSRAKLAQRESEPTSTVVPLVLTKMNLKMRWADYEFDRDSDYEDDAQSTAAGPIPSASDLTEPSNPDDL